jgi:hypothetical protein
MVGGPVTGVAVRLYNRNGTGSGSIEAEMTVIRRLLTGIYRAAAPPLHQRPLARVGVLPDLLAPCLSVADFPDRWGVVYVGRVVSAVHIGVHIKCVQRLPQLSVEYLLFL